MRIWLVVVIVILIIILTVALNIFGTNTVLRSSVHTKADKRKYVLLIWLLPLFGVILSMLWFEKDLKKKKDKSEQELVSALKKFTESVDHLKAEIEQKKNDDKLH
jgi:membrane protease YdiL (CAAX protease family)